MHLVEKVPRRIPDRRAGLEQGTPGVWKLRGRVATIMQIVLYRSAMQIAKSCKFAALDKPKRLQPFGTSTTYT